MFKFNLNNLTKLYLIILSYPSVIKMNTLKQLFILMILIFSTLMLTTGFIHNIKYEIIKLIIINFTMIYFLFIIINLIIRIYNMFIRVAHYFLQNTQLDRGLIIGYYFYNLFGILLTSILLYKVEFSMIQYDPSIINYIYIYIFFTLIISLIYIDYISGLEINIKKINITKFTHLFIYFNLSLLFICLISSLKITIGEFIINDKELLQILAKFNITGADPLGSGSLNQNHPEINSNQGEDMDLESDRSNTPGPDTYRSNTPVPDILLHTNNNDTVNTLIPAPRGRSLQRATSPSTLMTYHINNMTPYITELDSLLSNQKWLLFHYHPLLDIATLNLQLDGLRNFITDKILSNTPIPEVIEEIHSRQLSEFQRIVAIESMYIGIPLRYRDYYPPLYGYNYPTPGSGTHLDRPSNWPALRPIAEPSELESQLKLHKFRLQLHSPLKYYQLYSSLDLYQSRASIELLNINNFLPK